MRHFKLKLPFFWSLSLFFFITQSINAQINNGSFEDIFDCPQSSGCNNFKLIDNCLGPDWQNANADVRVLENICVNDNLQTNAGSNFLRMKGRASVFQTRDGDAAFTNIPMLKGQVFTLDFSGITLGSIFIFPNLEFYAVKEMSASLGPTLNLNELNYIRLIPDGDFIGISNSTWSDYSVTLDLRNNQFTNGEEAPLLYNHLLIIANTSLDNTIPTCYLDDFSITPCEINLNASLEADVNDSDANCGSTSFTLDGALDMAVSYIWDFGDGSPLLETTESEVDHIYQLAGIYQAKVTIIDGEGCIDVAQTEIDLDCDRCAEISAEFEFEHTYTKTTQVIDGEGNVIDIIYDCKYEFTDLSTPTPGFEIVSWHWDFGDGTTSSEQNPEHYLEARANPYTICLTITDSHGCTNEFCQEIFAHCGRTKRAKTETEKLSSEKAFSVFPNPVKDILTISFVETQDTERNLSLINTQGQTVRTIQLPTGVSIAKINTSDIPAGIYHLMETTDKHMNNLKRVLIIK